VRSLVGVVLCPGRPAVSGWPMARNFGLLIGRTDQQHKSRKCRVFESIVGYLLGHPPDAVRTHCRCCCGYRYVLRLLGRMFDGRPVCYLISRDRNGRCERCDKRLANATVPFSFLLGIPFSLLRSLLCDWTRVAGSGAVRCH
jgi:hypothetical protein